MDLQDIAARASLPCERRMDRKRYEFLPTSDDALDEREARYVRSVTNGDADRFRRLLAARSIEPSEFRRSLSDVRVHSLPAWAGDLERLCDDAFSDPPPPALPEMPGEMSAELLLRNAIDPFVRVADRRLDATVAQAGLDVLPDARAGMREVLERRLVASIGFAVAPELEDGPRESLAAAVAGVHERWNRRSTWNRLFERLPVAARVVATVHRHTQDFLEEFLDRLACDTPRIAGVFFNGRAPGPLTGFDGGAGDTHERGRAVSLLEFEDGRRLVYKPRDVRIGSWFFRAVDRLPDVAPDLALHTRTIDCRDGYAWDGYVSVAECASDAEVTEYFRRMGATLRVLQFVEGRDFHHENILPAGAMPAAVDLETLLQPRHRPPAGTTAAEAEVQRRVDESALHVGILSLPIVSEPGRRAIDLGALATPRVATAPFKIADQVRRAEVYGMVPLGDSAPLFEGAPVDPAGYLDDVEEGYADMGRVLREHGVRIFDETLLDEARELPVRVIHRPTQVYVRLLAASFSPSFLEDGTRWDACLQKLWKGYLRNPEFGAAVYESELRAVRELDVPVFYARPGSDKLFLDGGGEEPGFFAGTAAERLRERLRATPDPGSNLDLVRSGLSLHRGDEPRPIPPVPPVAGVGWLDVAADLGRFLVDQAVVDEQGNAAWLGVGYQPWADTFALGLLDAGVYAGVAGLGLVLSDLAEATAEPRLRVGVEACRGVLARAIDRLPGEIAARAAPEGTGRRAPIACGLHFGLGGVMRAALRLDPARAARMRDELPYDVLAELAPVDLASGLAGLCAASGRTALADLRDVVRARRDEPAPYPHGSRQLDGLPGPRAGIALVLGEPIPDGPPTTGRLLARIAAGFGVDGVESRLADASLLDRLELGLAAYGATADERYRRHASAAAADFVSRHRARGSWFPETRRADAHNLSAVFGIGAVAHALLRLERPGAAGSLRLPPA